MRRVSSLLGVLLGASALLSVRQVAAEEKDAERLFREGRALVVEGRFAEACSRLEQSQRLEPRLGTKLNVAFCHERLGKIATAWVGFQEALSTARAERDATREGFARTRVDALRPRVPWLRVRGPAGSGVAPPMLLLDGAPLEPSRWGQELPVDPGEHTLLAVHGGEEYWRTTLALRESEHVEVAIPAAVPTAPSNAATLTSQTPRPAAAARAGVPDQANARATETRAPSRYVFEVGGFLGLIHLATRDSEAEDPASIRGAVVDDDATSIQRLSCASAICDYFPFDSVGVLLGVAGFVGYAADTHTDLGVRFLIGPRVGGGALVTLGPSVSFVLKERFTLGPTLLFGAASHAGEGLVEMEGATGPVGDDGEGRLRATLGLSIGLGAELGLKLFSDPTGSLILQATPLVLYGANGLALSLPLGVVYRWN